MKITKIPSSRTGIFVLICFSLLVIALFIIGDKQKLFSNTTTYFIKFREVNDLKRGAVVMISGINIGSVRTIELPKKTGDSVLVEIHLVKDATNLIHQDSKASVTTVGLVGDKIVAIAGGSDGSPLVSPGGLITGESQKDFMSIADTVTLTIKSVKNLTDELAGLFKEIRSGKGSMGKLLTDEGLYRDIRAIVTNSDKSISSITKTAKELEIVVDSALVNFAGTSTEIKQLGHNLNSGKGTIGKLLNDTIMYSQLLSLTESIQSTVAELKDAMAKISGAAGNTEEVTEALKHNFLVKGYFEDRGYWDASEYEKKIDQRIKTLQELEKRLDAKAKILK
ncbi:MAG: MlaD family protein [bacterium]